MDAQASSRKESQNEVYILLIKKHGLMQQQNIIAWQKAFLMDFSSYFRSRYALWLHMSTIFKTNVLLAILDGRQGKTVLDLGLLQSQQG